MHRDRDVDRFSGMSRSAFRVGTSTVDGGRRTFRLESSAPEALQNDGQTE